MNEEATTEVVEAAARRCYQAEVGLYEDRYIAGYYDTPERAMAAMRGNRWRKTTWSVSDGERYPTWDNDLDWDEAVRISQVDLVIVSDGPERAADEAVVQTYRESDGGWDYLPERVP